MATRQAQPKDTSAPPHPRTRPAPSLPTRGTHTSAQNRNCRHNQIGMREHVSLPLFGKKQGRSKFGDRKSCLTSGKFRSAMQSADFRYYYCLRQKWPILSKTIKKLWMKFLLPNAKVLFAQTLPTHYAKL